MSAVLGEYGEKKWKYPDLCLKFSQVEFASANVSMKNESNNFLMPFTNIFAAFERELYLYIHFWRDDLRFDKIPLLKTNLRGKVK